jgi:MFS transporter, ACS family, hexuronate transporter
MTKPDAPSDIPARSSRPPRAGLRWWIVWTLFGSTVLNYISRQTFSVLAPVITTQFHLTHTQLSRIFGAFQVSYALTWFLGGIFLDIVGTRIGLALAVIFWSIINACTGLVNSVAGFAACRFLLGIGEGLNWPGASKAVAEWFPGEERSVAVAIFDSGSSIGGAIAAVVMPVLSTLIGWRWSFAFSGALGFVWLIAWLRIYHPITSHPRLSAHELATIRAGQDPRSISSPRNLARWLSLLRDRNVWGTVLGRALTDPIWWFYVFWLPQYLSDAHGFSLQRIAAFSWIPFVAADIGNFTGGFLSRARIRRGASVIQARRWVCAVSCIPTLMGIPAARVHSPYTALLLISVAVWGYAAWSTMGLTLPSDLFPQDVVATVTGFSGLAAGLVGTLFTIAVGFTVDRFSYGPAFLVAGCMPLAATACVFLLIRPRSEDHSADPQFFAQE